MRTKHLLLLTGLIFLFSCKKDDSGSLGGSQSTIGALNNTFAISVVPGVQNFTAKVTALEGDISTITYTATVSGSSASAILAALSGATVTGNSFTRTSKYRITTNGIQSVYPDGDLILVKYDAKVGDQWKLNIGKGSTMVRTVTSVSTTDDYDWNSMKIKVIKVEETGRGLPGVKNVEFVANHKFGLVGVTLNLEDGSSQQIAVYSTNTNE